MAEQFAIAEGTDKLLRSHLKHFIDASFGGETPNWFKVGRDNSELTMDLSPSTETVKNVWDETDIVDNGYEPNMSVDPYYARKGDSIYPKVKDTVLQVTTARPQCWRC